MPNDDIQINDQIAFLMSDVTCQRGIVCGFVQINDVVKIIVSVTTGREQGRTFYVTEEFLIGVVG